MRAFLLIVLCGLIVLAVKTNMAYPATFQRAYVTGYSTRENLTGCFAPGQCRQACGGLLNDRALTVAANPRYGLGCGARIMVCGGGRCVKATVRDRTASRFDFEFTYALAVATGAPRSYPGFASPRWIHWRRL